MSRVVEILERQSRLLGRLVEARRLSDELFAIIRTDALYERPIAERHRIVFYIGHLEAFDWNLLRERMFGLKSFDPELDKLFSFGIDPVDGGLPVDQPYDWPTLERVRSYVDAVRSEIDGGLSGMTAFGPQDSATMISPFTLLNVAIEHRLMHAETLTYMFHQMPYVQKIANVPCPDPMAASLESRMIGIPAGPATLGLSRSPQIFGWDNEYEVHTTVVPAFAIENHKVTNRQYLKFVEAGGYENPALWSPRDWAWKATHHIQHPVFWRRFGSAWQYRTMFREIPLTTNSAALAWPVYVSHAEASAYVRWAEKSLPTEAQWHRAAYGTPEGSERQFPWGDGLPTPRRGNFNFERWDPTPVGTHPEGSSAFGVHDLLGNGWEWTSSRFQPLPGFKPFSFYPGYSGDFFDGKHYVIKGGSARTAASILRRSFRNWFQPHYQYAYAGFRCASN